MLTSYTRVCAIACDGTDGSLLLSFDLSLSALQLPDITAVTVEFSPVTAGDSFDVFVTLQNAVLNAGLQGRAVLQQPDEAAMRRLQAAGISCEPVNPFTGDSVNTTCYVAADAVDGNYTITATVITPGNGGVDTNSSATVEVIQGVVSPAATLHSWRLLVF